MLLRILRIDDGTEYVYLLFRLLPTSLPITLNSYIMRKYVFFKPFSLDKNRSIRQVEKRFNIPFKNAKCGREMGVVRPT